MSDTLDSLIVETAVEITQSLRDLPEYETWFAAHMDALEGRSGLAHVIASLAQRVEAMLPIREGGKSWLEYDWYLTCDAIAKAIVTNSVLYLDDGELRACFVRQ